MEYYNTSQWESQWERKSPYIASNKYSHYNQFLKINYKDAYYDMDKYVVETLEKHDPGLASNFKDGLLSYSEIGFNPLTYFVRANQYNNVHKMLTDGANPDGIEYNEEIFGLQVPLYFATDCAILKLLLEFGANPNYYPSSYYKIHGFNYENAKRGLIPFGPPFYSMIVQNSINTSIIPHLKLYFQYGACPNTYNCFVKTMQIMDTPINEEIFKLLVANHATLDSVCTKREDYNFFITKVTSNSPSNRLLIQKYFDI